MLEWNRLHQGLEKASSRHRQLAAIYEQFAKFVADQITEPTFHIKGIGISLHLDHGYFDTTFAGRTLQFTFESVPDENGIMIGKVSCHRKKLLPSLEYISIGEFQFTGNGQTNLVDPIENDPISIDVDLAALYVVLNFIHESLSQ